MGDVFDLSALPLEDTADALRQRPVSPDQLKVWSRCPVKFDLQFIKQLSWPQDRRHFKLGQSVHKLMEYQARGLDCQLLLDHAEADIKACYEALMAHPASQWPVVANEWGFLIPLPLAGAGSGDPAGETVWLTGRIDRVAWQPETGTLWIIDWKTGTSAPRFPAEDWQTVVYCHAVVEAYGELRHQGALAGLDLPETLNPGQVRFLYLEVNLKKQPNPVSELEVPYDQARHQLARQTLQNTLFSMRQRIARGEFTLPPSCPDPFCPYGGICGINDPQDAPD